MNRTLKCILIYCLIAIILASIVSCTRNKGEGSTPNLEESTPDFIGEFTPDATTPEPTVTEDSIPEQTTEELTPSDEPTLE